MSRRRAALEEIARAKPEAMAEPDWMADWARIEEHERLAEAQEAVAADRIREELVRRWERGSFAGLTLHAGADGTGLAERR